MRFKNQQQSSSVPEVNLVPMMDVMMSVLTFFIITSMSLTGQRLANINLPGLVGRGTGEGEQKVEKSLEIGLNRQGDILLESQVITVAQLSEKIESYLSEYPNGTIVLKADRELPYEEVVKLLKELTKIGGSNISLAIERR